jgi:hypothetical protein
MYCSIKRHLRHLGASTDGQATVEAAVLIPVLFLLILMLTQPVILLYNHIVMGNAAAEGCRLLATGTRQGMYSQDKYEGYVKRRLASIPPLEIFHVRGGVKGWNIALVGDENSKEVTVRITNKLKPLPLLDWGFAIFDKRDENGYITQEVEVTMPTQPAWVWESGSGGPAEWTRQWQ